MMLERPFRGMCLLGLFLCTAFINIVPCAASRTTLKAKQRQLGFTSYDMPPFALSFQSPNGLRGDQEVDGELLASTLGEPLKLIVAEFLLEAFRMQLAGAGEDPTLPEMVRQLVTLDLKVAVVARDAVQQSQGNVRRHLQLLDGEYIEFYAQFTGLVHFVEPLDSSSLPSKDFMWDYLGQWVETAMENRLMLKQRLLASDDPMLQNMRDLGIQTNVKEGDFPYGISSSTSSGRSPADKGLIAALVVIGVATVVLATSILRPYVVRKLTPMDGAFPRADDPHTVLPGRKDAIDVLNRSDRWLQLNRPDLFDAVRRTASPKSMGDDADPDMIMRTPSTQSSQSSNPFQFLYGGMFLSHKKRSGSEENVPSLASQDENAVMDDIDSSPTNTWWNKLAATLNNGMHHRDGHGLVCDENPRDYNFAFRDFPRHDGTPCLIYTESDDGLASREATYSECGTPTTPTARTVSLTDNEFLRQLSMQSNTSSLEEKEPAQDESDEVDFTKKLERLVAMRRRRYEKEMIIEKGREARRKERGEAEARERELKLRRHEMELDLKEIEASLTPRALTRKSYQTQDDSGTGSRKSHRLTSSDSNFFSPDAKENNTASQNDSRALAEAKRRIKENRSGGTSAGPSTRHEDDSSASGMPPKRPASRSPATSVSSTSSWELPVHDPHPHAIQPRKGRHRKSHRRSSSHGTKQRVESLEEKKDGDGKGQGHKSQGSNADDVMTFGIAAYTQFV